jgi:hypothetical protein
MVEDTPKAWPSLAPSTVASSMQSEKDSSPKSWSRRGKETWRRGCGLKSYYWVWQDSSELNRTLGFFNYVSNLGLMSGLWIPVHPFDHRPWPCLFICQLCPSYSQIGYNMKTFIVKISTQSISSSYCGTSSELVWTWVRASQVIITTLYCLLYLHGKNIIFEYLTLLVWCLGVRVPL